MVTQELFEVEQAKEFLKNRILAQAASENVSLTPAEIAMLTYSEPRASDEQRGFADQVDAELGADTYEAKVSDLIRHAYKSDVAAGAKSAWAKSLRALQHEDLYVLVMVANAGVEVAGLVEPWYVAFATLDFVCLATIGAAGFVIFFTPAGSFLRSNVLRACLFLTWIAGLWGVGEWSRRRGFRRKQR